MVTNVQVEIDQDIVNHVCKILADAPDKAQIVFRNAINRGLTAGKTQADKEIKQRYAISSGNLNGYMRSKVTTASETGLETAGEIWFGGEKIPVYKFQPRPKERSYTSKFVNGRWSGWRVNRPVGATDIKASGYKRFRNGFIAQFESGHKGIFRRTGGTTRSGAPKIEEYWGPSVADMLDYEEARENVQERAAEVVNLRMDHELYRILNGF